MFTTWRNTEGSRIMRMDETAMEASAHGMAASMSSASRFSLATASTHHRFHAAARDAETADASGSVEGVSDVDADVDARRGAVRGRMMGPRVTGGLLVGGESTVEDDDGTDAGSRSSSRGSAEVNTTSGRSAEALAP